MFLGLICVDKHKKTSFTTPGTVQILVAFAFSMSLGLTTNFVQLEGNADVPLADGYIQVFETAEDTLCACYGKYEAPTK